MCSERLVLALDEQPTTGNQILADAVRCFTCGHRITDPNPIASCPRCGWQERLGAD